MLQCKHKEIKRYKGKKYTIILLPMYVISTIIFGGLLRDHNNIAATLWAVFIVLIIPPILECIYNFDDWDKK